MTTSKDKPTVEVKRLRMLPNAEDYAGRHKAASRLDSLAGDFRDNVRPAANASVQAVSDAYKTLYTLTIPNADARYALFHSVDEQRRDAVRTKLAYTPLLGEFEDWVFETSGLGRADARAWMKAINHVRATAVKAEVELARFLAS